MPDQRHHYVCALPGCCSQSVPRKFHVLQNNNVNNDDDDGHGYEHGDEHGEEYGDKYGDKYGIKYGEVHSNEHGDEHGNEHGKSQREHIPDIHGDKLECVNGNVHHDQQRRVDSHDDAGAENDDGAAAVLPQVFRGNIGPVRQGSWAESVHPIHCWHVDVSIRVVAVPAHHHEHNEHDKHSDEHGNEHSDEYGNEHGKSQ